MPKSWEVTFRARDYYQERSNPQRDAERAKDEGGEPCSRQEHCSGRRIVTENGERQVIPARTYGHFCPSCQGLIATCLAELPPAYVRLAGEIGEPSMRGAGIRSPFGPKLPIRADVDYLMRQLAETLASWTERVRATARLSALDTRLSRLRSQAQAVAEYAQLLGAHMAVLLALEPGPMMRSVPVRSHVDPDLVTMLLLGGQDAGEEVLGLHRSALLVLGEVVRQREAIVGVPCRRCEAMALVRAEPPSDPGREAMHSECRECRDLMDGPTFFAWAKLYSRWAESSGVACRRCQSGRCAECQWAACSCGARGHVLVSCVA